MHIARPHQLPSISRHFPKHKRNLQPIDEDNHIRTLFRPKWCQANISLPRRKENIVSKYHFQIMGEFTSHATVFRVLVPFLADPIDTSSWAGG
jgi:hypothetical protein